MCQEKEEKEDRRWMDSIKHNMTEKGLSGEEARDQAALEVTSPKQSPPI